MNQASRRLYIISAVIVVVAFAWAVWNRWPGTPDAVTQAATPSGTVEDLRDALNHVAPSNSVATLAPMTLHQAIDSQAKSVNILLYVGEYWPDGKPVDRTKIAANDFMQQLTPALATAKASTVSWDELVFTVMGPHNPLPGSSPTVLSATYSHHTADRINLSHTSGKALYDAADSKYMTADYAWK
jgi:hypothetical protein